MKFNFTINTKSLLLVLFVLIWGCQDFDNLEKDRKQNFLKNSLERKSYNSYTFEERGRINEIKEDIAYSERETYSNKNAYNEFKNAYERCSPINDGRTSWFDCVDRQGIIKRYHDEREKEAVKRFEEEQSRLKEEGLVKREKKIIKIMEDLNYSYDYEYNFDSENKEILQIPFYQVSRKYTYYIDRPALIYESDINNGIHKNFLEKSFKAYKIRKKYRQLRREEAQKRLKPYTFPITIRSFHPHAAFADGVAQEGDDSWMHFLSWIITQDTQGIKFSGDNRGFSLDDSATARASMTFELDPITGETRITNLYSDPTRHPILGEKTGIPRALTGTNLAGYSAGNPLISNHQYLVPDIDITANLQITRDETSDEDYDILKVRGFVRGDDYPNTEAFIKDKSGNKIFLDTDVRVKGFDHIPKPIMKVSFFPFSVEIMNIDLEIKIDEDENFVSVKKNGQWVSIWEYNLDHLYKSPNRRRR